MSNRRCHEALSRLYPYLDGEVTWYRKMRIRRHLRSCGGCGPAFSFESQFLEMIRDRLGDQAPPDLMERIQDLLRHQGSNDSPDSA